MVTPWFVSNIGYTIISISISTINIDVLKTYFSRFLTTNPEHLFRRVTFDGFL